MDDGFVELLNLKANFTLINVCRKRMNKLCLAFIGQLKETAMCSYPSLSNFLETSVSHLMEFRN